MRYKEVVMKKLKIKMPVPQDVAQLHAAFKAEGEQLYLVGGAVRDFAKSHFDQSHYQFKDHDLATSAHPERVEEILRKGVHKKHLPKYTTVRPVGKSFGVILVTVPCAHADFPDLDYEIATFRKDAKTGDGRRPDHVTFSTIEDDAARRDLTVNALYYDMDAEEILDFHTGLEDVQNNRARFVGDARERLKEDKLRALRFVRFHGRMHPGAYHTLDKAAALAIIDLKLRPEISDERIRDEFLKGLVSVQHQQNFLYNLNDLGLMPQVLPGLDLFLLLKPQSNLKVEVLAQILAGNSHREVRERLLELKYTTEEANDVEFLIRAGQFHKPEEIVDFHRARRKCKLGDKTVLEYTRRHYENANLIEKMLSFPYPTVRGEELMDQFQGKALGDEMVRREGENFQAFLAK
jgi:tRNA nucleotidyltransferase/poly(A) polymerase